MNTQKSLLTLLCCLFLFEVGYAQNDANKASRINGIYRQAIQIKDSDPEKAIGFLNQIIEIDSLVYGAYLEIAALKLRLNNSDEALDYVRKAIKKGFTNLNFIKSDPRFSSLKNDPDFLILFEDDKEKLLEEGVESRLNFFKTLLGSKNYNSFIDPDYKIVAYIFGDKEKFEQMVSILKSYAKNQVDNLFNFSPKEYVIITVVDSLAWSQKLNRSPYSLGGYSPESNSLSTYKTNTLIHEFTHVLHFNQQRILKQNHPSWINEGIATNFDAFKYNSKQIPIGVSNIRLPYLKSIIKKGDYIPWQKLFKMDKSSFLQNPQITYAQSGYIIRYLQYKGIFHDWYRDYISNYEKDPYGIEMIKKYLGSDLEKVEEDWKEWVMQLESTPIVPMGFNFK